LSGSVDYFKSPKRSAAIVSTNKMNPFVKKNFAAAASLVLLLLMGMGCRSEKTTGRNVLLITLDTLRADHVSAYGTDLAATPIMDDLAAQGILVENCYSPIPITLPAHLALFYSRMPHELSIYNNGEKFRQYKRLSLSEIFKSKGYDTAAFVSLGVLKKNIGVQEGFDLYRDDFRSERWYHTAEEINERVLPWVKTHADKPFFAWIHYSDPHEPYAPPDLEPDLMVSLNGEKVGEYCLQKHQIEELPIELNKGENILELTVVSPKLETQDEFHARFVLFELTSPNNPAALTTEIPDNWMIADNEKSTIHMPEKGKLILTSSQERLPAVFRFQGKLNLIKEENPVLYKREVEYLDRSLGQLFQELKDMGLWDRCLVVLAGDHGEGLGEYLTDTDRPHYGHLHYLYSPYVRVPLMFHCPWNKAKGITVKRRTSLLDVAPTVLTLMGWEIPLEMSGRSILDSSMPEQQDVQLETFVPQAYHDSISLIKGERHLILTPRLKKYEFYDLSREDIEKTDLFESLADTPEVKAMVEELNESAREVLTKKAQQAPEKDAREILRSLGYIR